MKKSEVTQLFALIRSNYPNFEITDEKKLLWADLMEKLPFETAVVNLKDYMRRSEYPPVAASIINYDPYVFTDYDRLRLETAERMQELEQSQQLAIDMPEHLRVKLLPPSPADE